MRGTTQVPSVYVILKREGKIAFLQRTNTDFMNGKYTLPAGHVEGLETYREAAVRETEEEAGVRVAQESLRHVHTMERHCGDHIRIDLFFAADLWEGEPINNEPEMHGELAWFEADNLPNEKIMDFEASALLSIAEGKTYSEYGWPQDKGL